MGNADIRKYASIYTYNKLSIFSLIEYLNNPIWKQA
jgi:hypothetical protein